MITENNSYVTLAAAEEYFNTRLYIEAWSNASGTDKTKALIMATNKINRLQFIGVKKDQAQPLQFPRKYPPAAVNPLISPILYKEATDSARQGTYIWYAEVSTPETVKAATCEEALALLKYGDNARIKLQEQGVTAASMGKISESYKGFNKLMSYEAAELLKPYTSITGAII